MSAVLFWCFVNAPVFWIIGKLHMIILPSTIIYTVASYTPRHSTHTVFKPTTHTGNPFETSLTYILQFKEVQTI